MTRQVWLVYHGDYSERTLDAVFADRDLAVQYAAGNSDREVNPDDGVPVIDRLPAAVPHLFLHARIKRPPAEPWEIKEETTLYPGIDPPAEPVRSTQWVVDYPSDTGITLTVQGTNIEAVRKTYSDRKAQAIAEFDLIVAADRARRAAQPPP